MKILLINPPRWNELVGKNPAIIENNRGFNPPLGLLYLGASIKKNLDCQLDILDTQPLKWKYSKLEEYLKNKDYDVIGISTMTFTLIDVFKTVCAIKKCNLRAKVVLGGPHVHLFPDETINLDGVDFLLMGESEFSFIDFLKYFNTPEFYDKISGLVYKNDEGKVIKNDFYPVDNLDEIPFPQRGLLGISAYNSLLSKGNCATTIITSRGCSFKCAFCDRPLSPITSFLRFRSAENVVEEISQCVDLGIKDFLFYDDTFTVNKERTIEICQQIIKRKLRIRWDIRTRIDVVNDKVLKVLKMAGCVNVHYGVEAGNDRLLQVLNKGFTIKDVKNTFKITRSAGLETLAYFMIGLPSQTDSDIVDMMDLIKTLNPSYVHFTIFSPYPGTQLYALGLEQGIIKSDVWRDFSRNPMEGFQLPFWEENFDKDQLYERIVKCYKHFYLRPSYILSRLMRINSREELFKKIKAALSVIGMNKNNVNSINSVN